MPVLQAYVLLLFVSLTLVPAMASGMLRKEKQQKQGFMDRFDDAMCDDLNTADALAAVFEYVREMNTQFTDANAPCKAVLEEGLKQLAVMTDVLGLLAKEYDATPEEIKVLVQARVEAKKAKNFAEADRIRDELKAQGIEVTDVAGGANWKRI